MLTLDQVKENVYFAFRKAQVESMETNRKGQLHVSDVISPCPRKVYYSKNDTRHSMSTEDMRSLYIGNAVHTNSQLAEDKYHELELAYDWVEDKPVDLNKLKDMPLDDPKWWDILIGSIDDLIQVDGQWVITDKKTTGSIEWFAKSNSKPSESHVDQINHYRVLLKKCMNIDASFGCVIYISNNNSQKWDKPSPLPFKLNPVEETLRNIKVKGSTIKQAMIEQNKPKRTKCFLCDGMCPYATMCFTEED